MEETIKLSDLQDLFKNKNKYFLNEKSGYKGVADNSDGTQGEYNEYFKFYKHPGLPKNVFMRETYHTDSYGDNDSLVNIDFVEGKVKQITVFESIN